MQEKRESELHRLAKQLIADANGIWTPSCDVVVTDSGHTLRVLREGMLDITSAAIEMPLQYDYVPDVQVLTNYVVGGIVNIEVTVTHGIDAEKREKIEQSGIPTLEIDLSGYPKMDVVALRTYILTKAPKTWIIPRRYINERLSCIEANYLAAVSDILRTETCIPLKEQVITLHKRGVAVELPLREEAPLVYTSAQRGNSIFHDITLSDGTNAVIAVLYKDWASFEPQLRAGVVLYLLDLRMHFKRVLSLDNGVLNSEGKFDLEVLKREIRGNLSAYTTGEQQKYYEKEIIDLLGVRRVFHTGGNLYITDCSAGYSDMVDVFAECRTCEHCWKFEYDWVHDACSIYCARGNEELVTAAKKQLRLDAERCGLVAEYDPYTDTRNRIAALTKGK